MKEFIQEHGIDVAKEIIKGAPSDAELFVYAYVAKSIDYLKCDGERWEVLSKGKWKPVVSFIADSFKNIAHRLDQLKKAVDDAEK
jgi:hypothetical protein